MDKFLQTFPSSPQDIGERRLAYFAETPTPQPEIPAAPESAPETSEPAAETIETPENTSNAVAASTEAARGVIESARALARDAYNEARRVLGLPEVTHPPSPQETAPAESQPVEGPIVPPDAAEGLEHAPATYKAQLEQQFKGAVDKIRDPNTSPTDRMLALFEAIGALLQYVQRALKGTLNDNPEKDKQKKEESASASESAPSAAAGPETPEAAVRQEAQQAQPRTPEEMRDALHDVRENKQEKIEKNTETIRNLDTDIEAAKEEQNGLTTQIKEVQDALIAQGKEGVEEQQQRLQARLDHLNRQYESNKQLIDELGAQRNRLTRENEVLQSQSDAAQKIEANLNTLVASIESMMRELKEALTQSNLAAAININISGDGNPVIVIGSPGAQVNQALGRPPEEQEITLTGPEAEAAVDTLRAEEPAEAGPAEEAAPSAPEAAEAAPEADPESQLREKVSQLQAESVDAQQLVAEINQIIDESGFVELAGTVEGVEFQYGEQPYRLAVEYGTTPPTVRMEAMPAGESQEAATDEPATTERPTEAAPEADPESQLREKVSQLQAESVDAQQLVAEINQIIDESGFVELAGTVEGVEFQYGEQPYRLAVEYGTTPPTVRMEATTEPAGTEALSEQEFLAQRAEWANAIFRKADSLGYPVESVNPQADGTLIIKFKTEEGGNHIEKLHQVQRYAEERGILHSATDEELVVDIAKKHEVNGFFGEEFDETAMANFRSVVDDQFTS